MSSLLLGIPLGVLASLMAWWILFHFFVPSIEFSLFISKIPDLDQQPPFRYRIKFKNTGRRQILDLDVTAELRVKALHPAYERNWTTFKIPVRGNRILTLKRGGNRIIALLPNGIMSPYADRLPPSIRDRVAHQTVDLEKLLELGSKATLRIIVFGYDAFSGSRKVFVSKHYVREDIRNARFKGLAPAEDETESAV